MIQVIRPLKCIETYGFGDPPFFLRGAAEVPCRITANE